MKHTRPALRSTVLRGIQSDLIMQIRSPAQANNVVVGTWKYVVKMKWPISNGFHVQTNTTAAKD